jgi:predicted NAD/FAD-dependent oxidoreductase
VIFEKARGAGGRTSTRRTPPCTFDHGAQYFTARAPELLGALDEWCAAGVAAPWTGRIAVLRPGRVETPDPEARYVGVPGMSAVAKHLASGLEVRFGTRIGAVLREDGGWRLRDVDGPDAGRYDGVVVTTPPAQAVPLLAAAPRLAEHAAEVRMLPCWTVMAAFPRALELPYDGAFVHDSPLGWVARESSKPGRPAGEAWVLQATPEWSTAHVDAEPDRVVAALAGAFGAATGCLSQPGRVAAHRWLYARTEEALGAPFLLDAEQRLAVAGDWCRGARVEAAFLSGREAAQALRGTFA